MTFLELIQRHFPPEEWGNALAVLQGESGGRPGAINNTAFPDRPGYRPPGPQHLPEYSVGLFQINTLAWPELARTYNLLDPEANVRAARHIFDRQGWRPWSVAQALGIPQGRRYVVEGSPLAPQPVPDIWAPLPGYGYEDMQRRLEETRARREGGLAAVQGIPAQARDLYGMLDWLTGNADLLLLRGGMMVLGGMVVLMGLYFLLRSL